MKICMPIKSEDGLESIVHDHFGSAAQYAIYDTETKELITVVNPDPHHAGGTCNPLGKTF